MSSELFADWLCRQASIRLPELRIRNVKQGSLFGA
jgi:hypothetical protein